MRITKKLRFLNFVLFIVIISLFGCAAYKDCNYVLNESKFDSKDNFTVKTRYCTVSKRKTNQSDSASIEGYVLSRIGGKPLGALVVLDKTNQRILCDSTGYFKLKTTLLNPKLTIKHLGYSTFVSKPLNVENGEIIKLNFFLGTWVVN